jgi:hypothetical protein
MTVVAMTETLVTGAGSAVRVTEVGHHIGILVAQRQAGTARKASPDVMRALERHKVIVVSIPIPLVQIHATRTSVAQTAMTDTTATTWPLDSSQNRTPEEATAILL